MLTAGVAVAALALTLPQSALASGSSAPEPIGDPIPARIQPGPVQVALTTVTTGVTAPLSGITAPGHPDEMFVVDQVGMLWSLDLTAPAPVTPTPVLDVSALLAQGQTPADRDGLVPGAFRQVAATVTRRPAQRAPLSPRRRNNT